MRSATGLPIEAALPGLVAALAANPCAVLQAPAGAGKSTVVPLALLDEPWARNKRILMLEPRRLAARAVAARMAQSLGEEVGVTVGHRMRMDTRVSRNTRVEVVTEGVLTRLLQEDPALEEVAIVIFDEFHERSLQADLGLALVLDTRAHLSPDLKVLVMSATLDGEAVARLLGDAPIVTAEGRVFPITVSFMGKGMPALPGPSHSQDSAESAVARAIQMALRDEHGDVLVFLPGAREIRRVQSMLQAAGLPQSVSVFPLFGELSGDEQSRALRPGAAGTRKVVLATNIAETSLTIEGVRVVVDSGLVRRSLFDPATGMSRLETQRISRASAQQRQGRAGRLEPGVCYRLWSEAAQRSLAPFTPPEIAEADLTSLALELASWGTQTAADLRWLDEPPPAMLGSARDLLQRLGALDSSYRITSHGREMSRVGVHPRLAHMLLRAASDGALPLAADLAALLSDRDLLRGPEGVRDPDMTSRLAFLNQNAALRGYDAAPRGYDTAAIQRVKRVAKDLQRQIDRGGARVAQSGTAQTGPGQTGPGTGRSAAPDAGALLAFAYPDRVGLRRAGSDGRYTLANGRGAHFAEPCALARQELIVAVDLDDQSRDARILLAAALSRQDLQRYLADRLQRVDVVQWSSREAAVLARRQVRLDAIVLDDQPLPGAEPEAVRAAMLEGIREVGIGSLPWTREARAYQARVAFVRGIVGTEVSSRGAAAPAGGELPEWPDMSDDALASSTARWLAPWLDGITRKDHLARLSLVEILRSLLTWEQQRRLDELAPSQLQVPSGSNIRIDYLDELAPVVSVRLQEVFGLEASPLIGGGRVPITFKLLSPAQRPVQVTRDLAGFWRGSYAEVRKDLRGRYPKHYWPDNPLEAEPTRGVRRRP
ncbi:MAG TPA: ATP-dependent helicase HrpB [Steroidobacteraceae bacterium]|nr:ATP-dependent helicase HrpB [Steroidobacteraceae bacterium]